MVLESPQGTEVSIVTVMAVPCCILPASFSETSKPLALRCLPLPVNLVTRSMLVMSAPATDAGDVDSEGTGAPTLCPLVPFASPTVSLMCSPGFDAAPAGCAATATAAAAIASATRREMRPYDMLPPPGCSQGRFALGASASCRAGETLTQIAVDSPGRNTLTSVSGACSRARAENAAAGSCRNFARELLWIGRNDPQ